MIKYLYRTMSLNNLRSSRPSGQIATLLILIMVAVLIFILVTANIGQISLTTTNLANAADSASLSLASQLGTKSRMLWIAMGYRVEKCVKTSILGTILSILVAIVAIIVAPYLAPALLGTSISTATIAGVTVASGNAAIVAGAIGGAIGGGVGTGTWNGALQGAIIGAAIGYGVASATTVAGPSGATVAGPNTAAAAGIPAAGLEPVSFAAGQAVPMSGTYLYSGSVITSLSAAVANVALTSAAAITNAYYNDKATADWWAAAAKAMNGLPENERLREGAFLTALSQTIDDPAMTQDLFDSDGDGDVYEKISNFQYLWDRRIADIRDNLGVLKTLIAAFFSETGPLKGFEDFNKAQYLDGGSLDRAELATPEEPNHSDGILVEWARALENADYDVSFWEPGVPPPACETCDPDYHDAIDKTASQLKEIVRVAEELRKQSLDQLAANWEDWIKFFYNPDTTGDYYDTLQELITGGDGFEGLTAWKDEIRSKRLLLPECTYGPCAGGTGSPDQVCNPPCRIVSSPGYPYPGTIDDVKDDEFDPALGAVTTIIDKIGPFRTAMLNFYNNMKQSATGQGTGGAYSSGTSSISGTNNTVTYAWTDSRGTHSVKAETHFSIPYVDTYKEGHWYNRRICTGIRNYAGSPTVEITRIDPVGKNMGMLGMWNPFFNGKVVRKSVGSYSFNKAAIGGIK